MWRSVRSRRFKKRYAKLTDKEAERVDKALMDLLTSRRPDLLGIPKHGRLRGCRAYELGRSCRILYRVDFERHLVQLFRLCSYKEVYG